MSALMDGFYDIIEAGFPENTVIDRKYQNVQKTKKVKAGENLVTYHVPQADPQGQLIYNGIEDDGIEATQNYADLQKVLLELDVEGAGALELLIKFRQYLTTQAARDLSKSLFLAFTTIEMVPQNIPNKFGSVYSERAFTTLNYNYSESFDEAVGIIEIAPVTTTIEGKVN